MSRTRPWLTFVVTCFALVSVVPGGSATGSVAPPRTPALEAARPAAASSTPPTASAERGRTTTIVLRVTTCARCPVTLQQALGDGTSWSSRTHHVRGGLTKFTVSSRRTRGMTFVLNPDWANVTDAATEVVTRYAHTTPGQVISNDVAKHKKRATPCWAGTTQPRVAMLVRVVTFSGRALGGGPGRAIRAWFKPMKTSTPPMTRTWRGTVGTQDVYSCDVS